MNCPIITLFDTHNHWETVCNFHLNSSLCAHSLFLEIPGNSHTNHLQLPVQISLGKLDLWTNYCTLYYCTLYTASMRMCMHVLYVCVCEWEWEREERKRERVCVCACVLVCVYTLDCVCAYQCVYRLCVHACKTASIGARGVGGGGGGGQCKGALII